MENEYQSNYENDIIKQNRISKFTRVSKKIKTPKSQEIRKMITKEDKKESDEHR